MPLLASAVVAPLRPLRAGQVVVAGGGRDLLWSPQQIAAALMARTSSQRAHQLLHGGARAADRAIGRAAGPIRNRELLALAVARAEAHSSPGDLVSVLVVAFPGGAGTASLVQQARRMAVSSPVPIAVAQITQAPALP